MNHFQSLFLEPHQRVFIPYFTLGDPTPEKSLMIIKKMVDSGAKAIELGIPFSDPVADGPTNQRAMQRALQSGMNFEIALDMLKDIRLSYPTLPIGLLIYYNLMFRRGLNNVYRDLKQAGVDAIVCAELPLEESLEHENALKEHDIGCVHMVFPNTPLCRAKECLLRSTAFTYVVARSGITGTSEHLDTELPIRLQTLRALSDSPLVVGFGLSKPEHVKFVWDAGAQGAIVASCFANWIEEHQDNLELPIQKMIDFMDILVQK